MREGVAGCEREKEEQLHGAGRAPLNERRWGSEGNLEGQGDRMQDKAKGLEGRPWRKRRRRVWLSTDMAPGILSCQVLYRDLADREARTEWEAGKDGQLF